MKKKLLAAVLLMIASYMLCYLAGVFCNASFNLATWGKNSRDLLACMAFLLSACSGFAFCKQW